MRRRIVRPHGARSARRDDPDIFEIQISFRRALGFGPGKARLLFAIAETGSIRAAAARMDMSYGRAWELVEEMNARFVQPIVLTQSGGNAGGGAAVTAFGFEVLRRYREMDEKIAWSIDEDLADFSTLLAARSLTRT